MTETGDHVPRPPLRRFMFGPFTAEEGRSVLKRKGVVVPLTHKAFEVLVALLDRRGRVVERDNCCSCCGPTTS